jgi:hypothetical protein
MKRVPALIPFLALVSALFIGILIFAYVETKRANPQMLDEQGHIVHGTLTVLSAGWIRARRPSAAPVARTSTPSWWRAAWWLPARISARPKYSSRACGWA